MMMMMIAFKKYPLLHTGGAKSKSGALLQHPSAPSCVTFMTLGDLDRMDGIISSKLVIHSNLPLKMSRFRFRQGLVE